MMHNMYNILRTSMLGHQFVQSHLGSGELCVNRIVTETLGLRQLILARKPNGHHYHIIVHKRIVERRPGTHELVQSPHRLDRRVLHELRNIGVHQPKDDRPGQRQIVATVQENGPNQRLKHIAERLGHRHVFAHCARIGVADQQQHLLGYRMVVALLERDKVLDLLGQQCVLGQDVSVELVAHAQTGERVVVDESGSQIGQLSLMHLGAALKDVGRHQHVEHGIAEELELLVASGHAVRGKRRVGEGLQQKGSVLERVSEILLQPLVVGQQAVNVPLLDVRSHSGLGEEVMQQPGVIGFGREYSEILEDIERPFDTKGNHTSAHDRLEGVRYALVGHTLLAQEIVHGLKCVAQRFVGRCLSEVWR